MVCEVVAKKIFNRLAVGSRKWAVDGRLKQWAEAHYLGVESEGANDVGCGARLRPQDYSTNVLFWQ